MGVMRVSVPITMPMMPVTMMPVTMMPVTMMMIKEIREWRWVTRAGMPFTESASAQVGGKRGLTCNYWAYSKNE